LKRRARALRAIGSGIDAQFSVIAVATPGKPGVVIDRIAYSAYGEATRTLRSDVNGDGFVNKDDYNGVIRSRLNTTIGSAGYVVEADLDRDGKVAQSDYDIAIADDGKSSSGGVGEAGLFAKGVRNGVGYCGYIFNDESGLYTVRFRSYSPTLGRWLERDPAGYVDGMGLYEYVRGGAITAVDPSGLDSWITHNDAHTGIQVEVRDPTGTQVIGCLSADFHAPGYMDDPGEAEGSCGTSSCSDSKAEPSTGVDTSSGSGSCASDCSGSGNELNGRGRLRLIFTPGPCTAAARRVCGSPEQDVRLKAFILKSAGVEENAVDFTGRWCKTVDAANGFEAYRMLTQNCNDFTDSCLDEYLGENWCWEIMTEGNDLVQQWDERFKDGRRIPTPISPTPPRVPGWRGPKY